MSSFGQFQNILPYLIEVVLKDGATAPELLPVIFEFGIFWFIFFFVASKILRHLSYDTPWLRKCMEQSYERGGKQYYEGLFGIYDKEEVIATMMEWWPNIAVINFQHVAGACLVIPSLLGLGDPKMATSLAMCGLMSEMGYEIEDMVKIFFTRYFTKDGKKKIPNLMLVFTLIHHCLATLLGLPMILHYRRLKSLHWLIFDLQIAGGMGILIEYSKFLDVSKPSDLRQFKAINFILFAFYLWSRLIHWVYLCGDIILVWYREKAWAFFIGGAPILLAFSCFNFFVCVKPMYSRFIKFLHASTEHDALPSDAPVESRRSSVAVMKMAAADLLGELDATAEAGFFVVPLTFGASNDKPKRHTIAAPGHKNKLMSMRKIAMSAPAHIAEKEWLKEE